MRDIFGKAFRSNIKAAVALLTDRAAQQGARRIIAQPEPGNEASQAVLRANGYVYSDEQGHYQKFLQPEGRSLTQP